MKKLLLLFAATFLLFQSCQKNSSLDAYAPHFHATAERAADSEAVTAHIKIPGRLQDKLVYLKEVKPINNVYTHKQRPQLQLAEFVFTTNPEEQIKDGNGYSWDERCGILTIKGRAPQNVKYASIKVTVPEGVNKIYPKTEEHQNWKKDCYDLFSQYTSPRSTNYGLILLHPGHVDVDDPEEGFQIKTGG